MSHWNSRVASLQPKSSHLPGLVLLPLKPSRKQTPIKYCRACTIGLSAIFLTKGPYLGREIPYSPRDCRQGSWSSWLQFLLLLQKRFRFFWVWVHFFSHSVGGKETTQRVRKSCTQQQNQRSIKETQKTGMSPHIPCTEITFTSCKLKNTHLAYISFQWQTLYIHGRKKEKSSWLELGEEGIFFLPTNWNAYSFK